jgi:uncharacterized membrane protein YbhN (UPF0104 family)
MLGMAWVAALVGFLYFVIPRLAGLDETLHRLRGGNPWWLVFGVLFEALSIAGDITIFHGVFGSDKSRIGWRASYQITLAGTAATKLLATAGAGGLALTAWALSGAGLGGKTVARRMVALEIVTYSIYMVALVVTGLGLWSGLFVGAAPFGLTVVPAVFGATVIAVTLSMLFVAKPMQRGLLKHAHTARPRAARWLRRAATLPQAVGDGLGTAIGLIAGRGRWLGLRHRHAVGGLPRVRFVAPRRGARDGIFRRHTRERPAPSRRTRWC